MFFFPYKTLPQAIVHLQFLESSLPGDYDQHLRNSCPWDCPITFQRTNIPDVLGTDIMDDSATPWIFQQRAIERMRFTLRSTSYGTPLTALEQSQGSSTVAQSYNLLDSEEDTRVPLQCCEICHRDPRCTMFEIKYDPAHPYRDTLCRRYAILLEFPATTSGDHQTLNEDVGPIGDWLRRPPLFAQREKNDVYVAMANGPAPPSGFVTPHPKNGRFQPNGGVCPNLYNDALASSTITDYSNYYQISTIGAKWMNYRQTTNTPRCFNEKAFNPVEIQSPPPAPPLPPASPPSPNPPLGGFQK